LRGRACLIRATPCRGPHRPGGQVAQTDGPRPGTGRGFPKIRRGVGGMARAIKNSPQRPIGKGAPLAATPTPVPSWGARVLCAFPGLLTGIFQGGRGSSWPPRGGKRGFCFHPKGRLCQEGGGPPKTPWRPRGPFSPHCFPPRAAKPPQRGGGPNYPPGRALWLWGPGGKKLPGGPCVCI